jgi:hypothetical protein
MDASFNVYCQDENGNFLSIQEVRERMCTDKPLIINDDLNWNGIYYPKFVYIRYMNKNLFRFSCPMSSEFNYESSDKPRTYIELNPKKYHSNKAAITGDQVTTYFISNPEFFWALPEIQ